MSNPVAAVFVIVALLASVGQASLDASCNQTATEPGVPATPFDVNAMIREMAARAHEASRPGPALINIADLIQEMASGARRPAVYVAAPSSGAFYIAPVNVTSVDGRQPTYARQSPDSAVIVQLPSNPPSMTSDGDRPTTYAEQSLIPTITVQLPSNPPSMTSGPVPIAQAALDRDAIPERRESISGPISPVPVALHQNEAADGDGDELRGQLSTHPSEWRCFEDDPSTKVRMLVCPGGMMIGAFKFASFGNPTGSCASPDEPKSVGTCNAADLSDVLARNCTGKDTCVVSLPDLPTCAGAAQRLLAEFECVSLRTVPIAKYDYRCAMQSSGQVSIACPDGEYLTHFNQAQYGRLNGSCAHGVAGNSSCTIDPVAVLDQQCIGKPSCLFAASPEALGRPCPGNASDFRLSFEYACGPTKAISTEHDVVKCEAVKSGMSLTMQCPRDLNITDVTSAIFGVQSGRCSTGFTPSTTCSKHVASIVAHDCIGKSSCVVNATEAQFNKPCDAGNSTDWSLSITYKCGQQASNSTAARYPAPAGNVDRTPVSASSSLTPAALSAAAALVVITILSSL